jgi:3-hydroxyisobutyrate dehydrogenase-like beta-hydroxyacid dehydrogenase
MSTISFALAERLATAHRHARQRFVSAPVFGRPEAAAAAELFIIAGGEAEAVSTCQPLFDLLGQRTFVVAAEAPKANLVKLSGNFLIASVIESLGEAFALTSKAGIDRGVFLEILTNTLFGAPVYKTYGELIAKERYTPAGFNAGLGYKDIHLALDAAETLAASHAGREPHSRSFSFSHRLRRGRISIGPCLRPSLNAMRAVIHR